MRISIWIGVFSVAVFSVILALSLNGCKSQPLNSYWLKPSASDSTNPDWWNLPTYREDKLQGTMTIVNDSSALYLRLFSRDRHLARRLEMTGLTIWLGNDADSRAPRLGIHYPLGMQSGKAAFHPNRYLPNANLPPDVMGQMISQQHNDFELLLGDSSLSGQRPHEEEGQFGLLTTLGEASGNGFEYVLRVDMGHAVPWIKPGAALSVEVESPAMDRTAFRGDRSGGRGEHREGGEGRGMGRPGGGGGGGRGGFGGGHRGGGPGEMHGDSTGQPQGIPPTSPIQLRFELHLAATPQAAPAAQK